MEILEVTLGVLFGGVVGLILGLKKAPLLRQLTPQDEAAPDGSEAKIKAAYEEGRVVEQTRVVALDKARDEGTEEAKRQSDRHLNELKKAQNGRIDEAYNKGLAEGRARGFEEGRAEFTMDVIVYCHEKEDSIIGWKRRKFEIGYDYQLFISGFPALASFKRPIHTKYRSEVNTNEIAITLEKLAESATSGVIGSVTRNVKIVNAFK